MGGVVFVSSVLSSLRSLAQQQQGTSSAPGAHTQQPDYMDISCLQHAKRDHTSSDWLNPS